MLGLDLIVVPLYIDDRAKSIAYAIIHSKSTVLLIADNQHHKKQKRFTTVDLEVVRLDKLSLLPNCKLVNPSRSH